jgi:hypothetical protein
MRGYMVKKKVTKEDVLKEIDALGIDVGQSEDSMTVDELQGILSQKKQDLAISHEKTVQNDLPEKKEEKKVIPGRIVSLEELKKYDDEGLLKTVHQVGNKYKITLK